MRTTSTNPFDLDVAVDDDFEVGGGLLSTSEDVEHEVPLDRGIEHRRQEDSVMPRAQRMVASVVRFMDPSQAVAVGAAIVRNARLENPDGYSAVKYLVTASVWVVMKEGMEGVNAMARLEQPFRYHRALGGGSFVRGLIRDVKRKAMIAVPIAGAWVGLGFGRDALFNWAMSDAANRRMLVLAMFFLDGPVLRTCMVGLLTMIAYEKGQQLVNHCSPLPFVPVEQNPQIRWYQSVLKGGTRIFYGVIAGEFLRETCNTVIGFAYLFQTRMSLMAGPYLDFGFREPAYYYGNTRRPFEKLDLSCARPGTVVPSDDEVIDGEPLRVAPSKCRQVAGLSTRVAIVIMVLGAATVVSTLVAFKVGGPDDVERQKTFGVSAWSTGGRMTYVGVVMGACTFLYGATMMLPTSVQRVGRWCGSLFGRQQDPDDIQMDDVERNNFRR